MSYKLKSTAKLVNSDGTGTPEFISALKPSTAPFQLLPYPTGAVSSSINVSIKAKDQGTVFVNPVSAITSNISIVRGTTSIPISLATTTIFPVNPGDVIKFTYTVQAIPANNPNLYFTAL